MRFPEKATVANVSSDVRVRMTLSLLF